MDILKDHWCARRAYLQGKLKGISAVLSKIDDAPDKAGVRTAWLAEQNSVEQKILELDVLIGQERVAPGPDRG